MPILTTRLQKPPVGERFILRERLIERLKNEADRPVTLVVGGAGYGKSILVSQWLDVSQQKYCWISLEEDCNNAQVFLSYLVAGVQRAYPGSLPNMVPLIDSRILPSPEIVAQTLINELYNLDGKLTIVADDLHKISNKGFFDTLNHLVRFIPENVRLILISRFDPPLKKAGMQAYNQVCEIRMADLRMDPSEIIAMAKQNAMVTLADGMARRIEEKTEGWALGINLLFKDYWDDASETISKLSDIVSSDNSQALFDLMEQGMDADLLEILMVASLFERFNLELMVYINNGAHSSRSKKKLEKSFQLLQNHPTDYHLIALDTRHEWYRLHHLVEEILKKKLIQKCSQEEIETYYSLAGAYFGSKDCYEEGIRYALIGGKQNLAVQIIASNWEHLIDTGQHLRLDRWVNMIPSAVRVTNPTLLVIRAYLADTIYYDYNAMGNYLERASKYLEDHGADNRLLGAFASVHSCYSAQTNDLPNARKFAEQALKTLLPDQGMLRDYALNYLVMATSRLQDAAEATALVENLEFRPESASDRHLMRINVIKMLFYWDQAKLENLKQPGKIVTGISDHETVWWMYKMGCYYLSQYYYMKNQISEVYSHIDAGIDCLFNAGPVWTLQLHYGGALAALAENDVPKAYSYLKSAKEFVEQKRLKSLEGYFGAFEVEFALKTNDIQKAWELNKSAKYSLHPPIKYYFIPQFTQVRLYIKKGDPDLMQEAYRLIQQHKKACEKIPYARIQITLLEAVWLAKSGLKERAVGALSQALALTLEEDYIRVFLDMGQPLKKLLAELPEDKKETPLVRNILMAFRYEPDTQDLISESLNLSSKETEILECVDRGMINKEIANRLFLSESTVKTYLYKIYQKLDVKNRTGALRKFRQSRPVQP